jgi:hypothetical protein
MKNLDIEGQGAFYTRCAELLGAETTYKPWFGRPPNRWNNRAPGNGRYPGFGMIRRFGDNAIHVNLHHPFTLNRWFKSEDEVYAALAAVERKIVP